MKTLIAIVLGVIAAPTMALAAASPEEELLEPEKAFALSVVATDAGTLETRWSIAKGYYLYRHKFKFELVDGSATLGEPRFPNGIRKHDEFFGDVETYRGKLTIPVPLTRTGNGAQTLKLKVVNQGCADLGVCYPPQTRTVSVQLAAVTPASSTPPPAPRSLTDLRRLIDPPATREFLPVEDAFRLTVERAEADAVVVNFQIADGYYLYRDKTRFELQGDSATLAPVQLPRGVMKDDPYIGKTEIWPGSLAVRVPLIRRSTEPADLKLVAHFQGCADKGICYPPTSKVLAFRLPKPSAVAAGQPTQETGAKAAAPAPKQAPPRADAKTFVLALITAFGTGLLLTFTPCVLPMIPILSSIIVGSGNTVTKLRGGLLSGSYVLGTAVTYTAGGVVAGATGDQLQAYFQNPWAIGTASAIFIALALSMFGFYELQMPSFIQSRLQQGTQRLKGGSFLGTFVLGLISALIVGACVSPLLITALGVAIASHDPVLGGAIMFAMALGMGVFLIAIGIGAGFLLPKAGAWMDKVKQAFGVMLIAVAIYLLGVLPEVPVLLLWAALLIVTAIFMGATDSLPSDASGWRRVGKGAGIIMLVWGVVALIGGLAGERDIFRPIPMSALQRLANGGSGVAAGGQQAEVRFDLRAGTATPSSTEVRFERVATASELDALLARAAAAKQPVMLDYYATWCTDCVRMEKTTFRDPGVVKALGRFALIKADVTENDDNSRALKRRFGIFGPPATLLFDPQGRELRDLRFYGYRAADEFLATLAKVP